MHTRNKIAVEGFAFENFTLPVIEIIRLTGKLNSDSATKGAETVSQFRLPVPTQLNELKHKPVPLSADRNAQRLLTGIGFSSFPSFLMQLDE
jgi:hypothetical protein